METRIDTAFGSLLESLTLVLSTVVSKGILDLGAELKKGKGKVENGGGLVMRITSHAVRAINECGLLPPNSAIEVTGVQEKVWKEVFPQVEFPTFSQASSTPHSNSIRSTQS